MKIRVELICGDFVRFTLPFGLRDAEITGWLDDKYGNYGWVDYTCSNCA